VKSYTDGSRFPVWTKNVSPIAFSQEAIQRYPAGVGGMREEKFFVKRLIVLHDQGRALLIQVTAGLPDDLAFF